MLSSCGFIQYKFDAFYFPVATLCIFPFKHLPVKGSIINSYGETFLEGLPKSVNASQVLSPAPNLELIH